MADITSFPTQATLVSSDKPILGGIDGPSQTFKFTAATKAGQVVIYSATSGSVTPAPGAVTEKVAGVAINDVASGAYGTVAMAGCIVKVVNADDTTSIPPGVWLQTNDNSVLGTVNQVAFTAAPSASVQQRNVVGISQETIAGGSFGYALILPVPVVNIS